MCVCVCDIPHLCHTPPVSGSKRSVLSSCNQPEISGWPSFSGLLFGWMRALAVVLFFGVCLPLRKAYLSRFFFVIEIGRANITGTAKWDKRFFSAISQLVEPDISVYVMTFNGNYKISEFNPFGFKWSDKHKLLRSTSDHGYTRENLHSPWTSAFPEKKKEAEPINSPKQQSPALSLTLWHARIPFNVAAISWPTACLSSLSYCFDRRNRPLYRYTQERNRSCVQLSANASSRSLSANFSPCREFRRFNDWRKKANWINQRSSVSGFFLYCSETLIIFLENKYFFESISACASLDNNIGMRNRIRIFSTHFAGFSSPHHVNI